MDLATLLGFILGIGAIIWSIVSAGDLSAFIDIPSLIIVIGGAFSATLISYPLDKVLSIFKIAAKTFFKKTINPNDMIKILVEMSKRSKKEGLLSLQQYTHDYNDDFFQKAIQMVVDGFSQEAIKQTLRNEIDNLQMRHETGIGIFKTLGAQFPAWGMIGTLIGLVLMLRNLSDPSTIGPSMAVAIITTFYGSIGANLICNPIATKLEIYSTEEAIIRELILEGIMSIVAGESYLIVEQKLTSFLSTEQKKQLEQLKNS